MADDKKPGWAEGRVRESADGLSRRRPQTPEQQRKLREAAEAAQQKRGEHDGDDRD